MRKHNSEILPEKHDRLAVQEQPDHRKGIVCEVKPPSVRDWLNDDVDRPATVDASLWKLAQRNSVAGLFKVAPGIHQVRGLDVANMTVVEGETGYVVIDPLTTEEAAREAFDLVREHLGDRPISAMIFTHSHVDHFGGGAGLEEFFLHAEIPLCAPVGFFEEAIRETIFAGRIMGHRTQQMFGARLEKDARGFVTAALGAEMRHGRTSLLKPNLHVDELTETINLDGVEIGVLYTPDAEAPAEMVLHFPEARALCMAEVVTRLMHNIYTPRGAQVRDALGWSNYIREAWNRFGNETDVMFMCHHWPVWETLNIGQYMFKHADLYRYIHDQTLRLANRGYNPDEIAADLSLPESLSQESMLGHYGTLKSNIRGVYQKYIGWFDGNPVNLDPMPPADLAKRTVSAMGGRVKVLNLAEEAENDGDLQWAAVLNNYLLCLDRADSEARLRQAQVFEKLGFASQSSINRNFYLSGREQLRRSAQEAAKPSYSEPERLSRLPISSLLDAWAVRLDGPAAAGGLPIHVRLVLRDQGVELLLDCDNGVLHARPIEDDTGWDVSVECPREEFTELVAGTISWQDWIKLDAVTVEGSPDILAWFLRQFDPMDNVLTLIGAQLPPS